jgi:hypothetical protein
MAMTMWITILRNVMPRNLVEKPFGGTLLPNHKNKRKAGSSDLAPQAGNQDFSGHFDKGKVVPVLTNHALCHEEYGGEDVQTEAFLTSAHVGGKWSASSPSHLTLRERAPSNH